MDIRVEKSWNRRNWEPLTEREGSAEHATLADASRAAVQYVTYLAPGGQARVLVNGETVQLWRLIGNHLVNVLSRLPKE